MTLSFVCGDARTWSPGVPAFDLFITHFVLDLYTPVNQERLIANLDAHAATEAHWIDTRRHVGNLVQARLWRRTTDEATLKETFGPVDLVLREWLQLFLFSPYVSSSSGFAMPCRQTCDLTCYP